MSTHLFVASLVSRNLGRYGEHTTNLEVFFFFLTTNNAYNYHNVSTIIISQPFNRICNRLITMYIDSRSTFMYPVDSDPRSFRRFTESISGSDSRPQLTPNDM
jgi:hypothetical protein